jgi:predicted phage-related endonuclease
MTASNAQAISANGKGLESYIWEVMAGKYATTPEESWSNADMERGKEYEAMARIAYEIERGVLVEQVGFVEYTGASPDGMVNDDGLVEIKCHGNTKFFQFSIEKKIESKYLWQMQMQMLVTGRQWCDYVAFSPNFEKSIVVVRVERDPIMQEKLLKGIEKGKALIKEIESKI